MRISIMLVALICGYFQATLTQAQDVRVERGYAFAQTHCASCHAIGPNGESPLGNAPPFRALHRRYPIQHLAESLAEGIVTAHPGMPQFQLDKLQIEDLIAYLKSLEG